MKRIGVLILTLLALGGCTLPGGAPDGPAYRVTVEFGDVLDLVPQSAVKVNDVTVGSVEKMWTGVVRQFNAPPGPSYGTSPKSS